MIYCLQNRLKRLEENYDLAEFDKCMNQDEMENPWKFDKAIEAACYMSGLMPRMLLYDEAGAQSDDVEIAKQFFTKRKEQAQKILKNGISKDDDRDPWKAKAEEKEIFYECDIALKRLEKHELHEMLYT